MIDLSHIPSTTHPIDGSPYGGQLPPTATPANLTSMQDGSEVFPYLWRYFLQHQPLREWLMRTHPYASASFAPSHIRQGISFCCNFEVPELWSDMTSSFDLGEMFVPDHAYSHFMCGSVVAATSLHKHLVCALGPAASREPERMASYRTAARRMIVDMGSSKSINIIEFSWMCDGALIVTAKILVPPQKGKLIQPAGCSGAFAVFTDAVPGGPMPQAPRSLVSFVEAPRCPVCIQTGCLGCYCQVPPSDPSVSNMTINANTENSSYSSSTCSTSSTTTTAMSSCSSANSSCVSNNYSFGSSAAWPPQIANDMKGNAVETYDNIRIRLDSIQHIAHVKITAHVVTTHQTPNGYGGFSSSYKLGLSRFVVKAVLFRPANAIEANTLRQVADKLRLLRSASIQLTASNLFEGCNKQSSQYQANTTMNQPMILDGEYNENQLLNVSQNRADMNNPIIGNTTCSQQHYDYALDPHVHVGPPTTNSRSDEQLSRKQEDELEQLEQQLQGEQSPDLSFISFDTLDQDVPSPPSPLSPLSPSETPSSESKLCVACVVRCVTGDGSRCEACHQESTPNVRTSSLQLKELSSSTQNMGTNLDSASTPVSSTQYALSSMMKNNWQMQSSKYQPNSKRQQSQQQLRKQQQPHPKSTSQIQSQTSPQHHYQPAHYSNVPQQLQSQQPSLYVDMTTASSRRHRGHTNSKSHTPAARLKCPRCDKTFSQQGSLNRHLKNIHDQRKIPCDYCMMTFGQMFDLKRHQRRKHADKQSTTVRRERVETRFIKLPVSHVAN